MPFLWIVDSVRADFIGDFGVKGDLAQMPPRTGRSTSMAVSYVTRRDIREQPRVDWSAGAYHAHGAVPLEHDALRFVE